MQQPLAYILIGIGLLALLAQLGGGTFLWLGFIAAGFIWGYSRNKNYGLLIPGCILMGIAVGLLLEAGWGWNGAFLISLGVGFAMIDRAEPRKNRWPVFVGAILGVLGLIVGLAESNLFGPFALVAIVVGIILMVRRNRGQSRTWTEPARPSTPPVAPSVAKETSSPATPAKAKETEPNQVVDIEAPKAETASEEASSPPKVVVETPKQEPDPELMEKLTAWRRETAAAEERAAYLILTNASLEQIAAEKPSTLKELRNIKGIGPVKLERYGEAMLDLISA